MVLAASASQAPVVPITFAAPSASASSVCSARRSTAMVGVPDAFASASIIRPSWLRAAVMIIALPDLEERQGCQWVDGLGRGIRMSASPSFRAGTGTSDTAK